MKRSKKYITLMEMVVVMTIIASITAIVSFNLKGVLDKSKVFQTKQRQEKLRNVLMSYAIEEGASLDYVKRKWEDIADASVLLKGDSKAKFDAWNKKFIIKIEDDELSINSTHLAKQKSSELITT